MVGLRGLFLPTIRTLALGYGLAAAGAGMVQAQVSSQANMTEAELMKTNLAQCMKDWDASTHMTKGDWERVCVRVVTDRIKFKTQQEQLDQRAKPN